MIILEGTGLERIQMEIVLLLTAQLPEMLAAYQQSWSGYDHSVEMALGDADFGAFTIEPPVNLYPGHRESMISMPKDQYPCISCFAYNWVRDSDSDGDQYESGTASVYVEGIVKADTEGVVNRAVQRYAEATHRVILSSRTINGIVFEVPTPSLTIYDEVDRPIGKASDDSFADGTGPVWWWQAFRLDYRLSTHNNFGGLQGGFGAPGGVTDPSLVGGTY
jgi:hypothetical protein